MPATEVPVGTLLETFRGHTEERLNRGFEFMLNAVDPVWKNILATSQGVVQADGELGRDYLIRKTFKLSSLAGNIQNAAFDNYAALYGEVNSNKSFGDHIFRQAAPTRQFPLAFEGAIPKFLRLTVPMRGMEGNVGITLSMAQMDVLSAADTKIIPSILAGHAQYWAHLLCYLMYADPTEQYRLGDLGASTGTSPYTIDTVNREITFYPPAKNNDVYQIGMLVDIWKGSGPFTRINELSGNRIRAFVNNVDSTENRVVIGIEKDTSVLSDAQFAAIFTTGNIGNAAFVNPANWHNPQASSDSLRFTSIFGLNSWMKNSGNLLGNEAMNEALGGEVNVDKHPRFKSYFKTNYGILTEHKFRLELEGFERGYKRYGIPLPDTFFWSPGVKAAYHGAILPSEYRIRNNRPTNIENEGEGGDFKFAYNGRTITCAESTWIKSGTMYGITTKGNNWKRHIPPDAAGLRPMAKAPMGMPIKLIAPWLTNGTSEWLPYRTANGAATDGKEMPSMLRMQITADNPVGMKITGLTEERSYGE